MNEYLTRDAEKLLAMLYKQYLEARKSGKSRDSAKQLGGSNNIKENLKLKDSIEDIDDYCRELATHEYLQVQNADDTVYLASLTNRGISKLERRFTDGLRSVIDFLAKFI